MEPNCNSVFLLGWKTPCPLWRKMPAGLWLVSHPLSSLSGDGSLTDFIPKSAGQFKAVTILLIRRTVQLLSFPGWAGFWLEPCSGSLVRLPAVLLLPWSFSPDLAQQDGLAACSWPGRRWAVSHVCCLTATGRLQLHDPEAPGGKVP